MISITLHQALVIGRWSALSLLLAAAPVWAQTPFDCSDTAYQVTSTATPDAQFYEYLWNGEGYSVSPIGTIQTININNIGFSRSEGLLYGWRNTASREVISVDAAGILTGYGLGTPAINSASTFNSGDVSTPDPTTGEESLFLTNNATGFMEVVNLTTLATNKINIKKIGGVAYTAGDLAFNPVDRLLYGVNESAGTFRVLQLDPANGNTAVQTIAGLGGTTFGAAWFDSFGTLFAYENTGRIYVIDLGFPVFSSPPTLAFSWGVQALSGNDGAACIDTLIGAAVDIAVSDPDPLEVGALKKLVITYTFENFSAAESLGFISVFNDLEALFGTKGVDWTLNSVSSTPVGFHHPFFMDVIPLKAGRGVFVLNPEMINDNPWQTLDAAPGGGRAVSAQVVVTLHLYTSPGDFCHQIQLVGEAGFTQVADFSTSGFDPDPDGDSKPNENTTTCVAGATIPVELMDLRID